MRMEIDAILFSASAGEMSYYFSHLDQIEVLSMDNKLEYFLGFHENKKIILTHTGLGKVQPLFLILLINISHPRWQYLQGSLEPSIGL